MSLLTSDSTAVELARRFARIRAGSRALIEPLSAEDCLVQTMPDVSPSKWHLAHTTWFFESFVLEAHRDGHADFDAAFKVLFNSYYEGYGPQHPRLERGLLSRPSLERVIEYREHVGCADDRALRKRRDDAAARRDHRAGFAARAAASRAHADGHQTRARGAILCDRPIAKTCSARPTARRRKPAGWSSRAAKR
jgi:hypothetical protein